jgi:hypothetical protein
MPKLLRRKWKTNLKIKTTETTTTRRIQAWTTPSSDSSWPSSRRWRRWASRKYPPIRGPDPSLWEPICTRELEAWELSSESAVEPSSEVVLSLGLWVEAKADSLMEWPPLVEQHPLARLLSKKLSPQWQEWQVWADKSHQQLVDSHLGKLAPSVE